jgi:membrane protease YdiL (CAAX protease family)
MSATVPAASPATRHPEWLILIATAALVVFYYLARADVVGVFTPERGWYPLTLTPLPPAAHFYLAAVLLGALPVAAARWIHGLSFRELGLGLGRWRWGLMLLFVGVPLAVLAGKIGAGSLDVRAVYPLDPRLDPDPAPEFLLHALRQFCYFGAWEVLFRGVLLFGLRARLGDTTANLLQTALSVTAHFGRALDETVAALPAGLIFGWIDLRVGSVWYVAIIHWIVGVSLDWFIIAPGN